jgi:hypothetical protein
VSNSIRFENAEVSSLKLATAKNGNEYITGFLVDHNAEGSYTTSKAFRTFDAKVIEALKHDLADFISKTPEEQKAAKAARPRITIQGWLKNSANAKGIWSETLMVESFHTL